MKSETDSGGVYATPPSVVTMMTSKHLTARAAACHLGVRRSTLRAWNESGVGPLPDVHGRYDPASVIEWSGEMAAAAAGDTAHPVNDETPRQSARHEQGSRGLLRSGWCYQESE